MDAETPGPWKGYARCQTILDPKWPLGSSWTAAPRHTSWRLTGSTFLTQIRCSKANQGCSIHARSTLTPSISSTLTHLTIVPSSLR